MKQMMIGIVAAIVFSSCTQVAGWFGNNSDSTQTHTDISSHAAMARDESITAANAYSDLFLDSAAIRSFVAKQGLPDSTARMIENFYLVRNYQYAWFASDGPTEQARGLWSLHAAEDSAMGKIDPAIRERMDTLLQQDSAIIEKNDSSLVQTELALTHQLVQYAALHPEHINRNNLYFLVPAKKQEPMQLADSILNKQKDSTLYAGNAVYNALKSQLAIYYDIAKNGGWDSLAVAATIKKGSRSPAVAAIKKRLQLTKDYVGSDTTDIYSDSLETAIKHYQQRHGFQPTGMINDSMVRELNIPVEQRIEQILVNMNRALWMPPSKDSNHIEVNIPSQLLYVHGDTGTALQMPVIVGREGTGTVMFTSEINKIVFNPAWNIPESIVWNEILPKMKADASYLKKNNIEVVKQSDSLPVLRQLPGKDNPLGKVKFLFPNAHDIYLHDTPDKGLFAKNERALSHGCIRVADANALAQHILSREGGWDAQKITAAMNSGKEQTVELKKTYPVVISYFTAWVDDKGLMQFRKDVYGHDEDARTKMFG